MSLFQFVGLAVALWCVFVAPLTAVSPTYPFQELPPLPPQTGSADTVSTGAGSVVYIQYSPMQIRELENRLIAARQTGEDVSQAEDLFQTAQGLSLGGPSKESDALYRQVDLLLDLAKSNADKEFRDRLVFTGLVVGGLLVLFFVPGHDRMRRWRERLHGPFLLEKPAFRSKKGARRNG